MSDLEGDLVGRGILQVGDLSAEASYALSMKWTGAGRRLLGTVQASEELLGAAAAAPCCTLVLEDGRQIVAIATRLGGVSVTLESSGRLIS